MMTKKLALFAIFLLLTVTARAQDGQAPNVLATVQRLRAEYPTPMSRDQIGELLNRVAWEHRFEGWGLLRKGGGTRCPAPQGVDVSCDILIHAPSVRHFDVLGDVDGAATPTWRDVGPCVLGPSSGCEMARFLAPGPPSGQPVPEPQPVPVPQPDPNIPRLFEQITALTRTVEALRMWADERFAASHQELQRLGADVSTLRARVELLEARPVPVRCVAGLSLGIRIPVACRLE